MSKYVKDLLTKDVQRRLKGVEDALVVNLVGMNSEQTFQLRKHLRSKNIEVLVVKNSLARRATQGTRLASAFEGLKGSSAILWGAEDFVSLVKEIVQIDKEGKFPKFETKAGAMDGERLAPETVKLVSKWPSRLEQLSILMGQVLSPGASLLSQINAPGGLLLSQIEKKAKAEDATANEGTEA